MLTVMGCHFFNSPVTVGAMENDAASVRNGGSPVRSSSEAAKTGNSVDTMRKPRNDTRKESRTNTEIVRSINARAKFSEIEKMCVI